ncbi:DegT/DnrJ/EryC1/StrS family aminotransferase [Amycolatopsis japonica]|uniref:DegT/DnrJ/EryC1/StrS family aminotransferase n=1 Tax=Amycolatopsis japonica TaxID=208439 RepID=UPI0033169927
MNDTLPPWRVTLADNTIGEPEIEAVTAVLRSRWLSAGAVTREFEHDFAERLGVPDAVAVSSGTAALHLAVLGLGLAPGDEVVLPALSFVAAAAVATLHGATPVFADVRSEADLTVDPADVAGLLTDHTKAVVAMHYGGYSADLAALREITAQRGIRLIEDAAHAPVVRDGDRMLGTVGDVGCFSFFATKNVTTGEGGMVVAADRSVLDEIRLLRSHHLTRSTWQRARTGQADYDVDGVGLNYRPTEISSALGRIQLGRLDRDRARRRELVAVYRDRLRSIPGLVIPFDGRDDDSAHHLMAVLLPPGTSRDEVRDTLSAARIQTSVHYPPTHRFTRYRAVASRALPVTERVASRLLSLPLHSRMSDADVELVADALDTALPRPR